MFQVVDIESHLKRLTSKRRVLGGGSDQGIRFSGVTRLRADERLVERSHMPVLKAKLRQESKLDFLGLIESHSVLLEMQIRRHEVADLGRSRLGHELGI